MCLTKRTYLEDIQGPGKRKFRVCNNCKLIFVTNLFHLSREEQKKRYENHKNGIEFPGYVKFLNKAIEPALQFLNTDMVGLDFGCGPVPTLSRILENKNIECENYDPIFFERKIDTQYDFVFATECFEHFIFPAKEIKKLNSILKKGGYLIIMTELWENTEEFKSWYYAKDPTHVSFYNKETFNYICGNCGFSLIESDEERVFIFSKK